MRPSLRLLNLEVSSLQGSRSLYVCSTCRQEVRSRPILARQFLRNASNAAPLTERVRRRIWGTDNPPGLKDPYGGEGVLERKWKNQSGQREESAAEEVQVQETENAATEEVATADAYEPATTWEGIPRIGHLGQWSDLPTKEADTYNPFMLKKKVTKKGQLYLAAHQAAVELCLLHSLNKPLTSICDVAEHEKPIFRMIWECKIDPNANGQWDKALVYPNDKAKDVLIYIFEQIGGQVEATAAEVTTEEANEAVEASEFESAEEPEVNGSTTPFFGNQGVQDKGFLSLPLNDAATKFAFLKRFSQLSGHYFPDPTINSICTVKEAVEYVQTAVNPKPKKLAEALAEDQSLLARSNVKIFTKRQKASHRDEELGRKKIIDTELRARGLLIE